MKNKLAFNKCNFILILIGVSIILLGFILMSGSSSGEESFNSDIFSFRRISLAPVISLFGFLFMIYAIMRKPKEKQ